MVFRFLYSLGTAAQPSRLHTPTPSAVGNAWPKTKWTHGCDLTCSSFCLSARNKQMYDYFIIWRRVSLFDNLRVKDSQFRGMRGLISEDMDEKGGLFLHEEKDVLIPRCKGVRKGEGCMIIKWSLVIAHSWFPESEKPRNVFQSVGRKEFLLCEPLLIFKVIIYLKNSKVNLQEYSNIRIFFMDLLRVYS